MCGIRRSSAADETLFFAIARIQIMLIYAHFDCEICKPESFWLLADSFSTVSKGRLSNVLQSAFVLRGDGEKEKKVWI